MTGSEIREALHEVGAATNAPPVDRVAFQRAVRRERGRRAAGRAGVLAAGVAAAAVLVAGWQVLPGGAPDRGGDPAGVAGTSGVDTVGWSGGVVWFVDGRRLFTLDPQGTVHDVGVEAEEVLGHTAEGAWVVGAESEVVFVAVEHGDEGPQVGEYSFERSPGPPGTDTPPVTGSVQAATLSADGRYLAWIDLDGTATSYDLKAGEQVVRVPTGPNTALVDVGAEGLLLSEDGDLVLRDDAGAVPVPTATDGTGVASTLARGLVGVVDRDATTRVYAVSGDEARLVDSVPGAGTLSPDAAHLVARQRDAGDTRTDVVLWGGEHEGRPLAGLTGSAESIAWADEGTVWVVAGGVDGAVLHACSVEDAQCEPLHAADDIRLADAGY